MNHILNQRHRFQIPDDLAYFNCAYMSPLASEVLFAVEAGGALKSTPWMFQPQDFFLHSERARSAFADVARCSANDLALVPSASYGLAVAARNLRVAKGERILVLDGQFPSNVYVWRELAAEVGAAVETVIRIGDENWTAALSRHITAGVAIVAVPNCHWADGGLVDLVAIGAASRQVGAALVIDATQSLGALPLDLEAVQPDFLVAAAYKWLMSPYGTGLLYVAPKHHGGTPIEHNWINRSGSEDFAGLVNYQDGFQPGARRFDMGEKANPPLLMGVVAAAEMLLEWRVARISATLSAKTDRIAQAATAMGFDVIPKPDRAPHLLSLGLPGKLSEDIGKQLAAKKIFISVRGTSLRVSPHVYNDDCDCERLIDALKSL